MDKIWLSQYPAGVAENIILPPDHTSLIDLVEEAFDQFGPRNAFINLDKAMTYTELAHKAKSFAGWLQTLELPRGSRVAVMMPNVLQYPVVALGTLLAGHVLVNVNPLYTARELEHQLKDADAAVLVILENFATVFQEVRGHTPVKHVVVATVGDLLGLIKGHIVNFALRRIKKQVPAWSLPDAVAFNDTLKRGSGHYQRPDLRLDDTAMLQYTGGTTGVSKGAELTHRNLVANVLQIDSLFGGAINGEGQVNILVALPLYHIFAFTVCMLYTLREGNCGILIANPRDLPDVIKQIDTYKPALIPAVNTLFNALANHADFKKLDFSNLKIALGGGMAVMPATAADWKAVTGTSILEGYGLSETSPVATVNPPNTTEYTGTIGVPLPSTEVVILDDEGRQLPLGERGEIAIRGPQVMKGYWNRPDETAKVMTADGYFRTGDIGVMDERGHTKIVDRKKDMILVSGFNVYPNEIEEVVTTHPKVLEAAAIGVADDRSGEVPKVFVVKKDDSLTEAELRLFMEENLTGYKRPKYVEFIKELPKTNVGKILRKDLRVLNAGRK